MIETRLVFWTRSAWKTEEKKSTNIEAKGPLMKRSSFNDSIKARSLKPTWGHLACLPVADRCIQIPGQDRNLSWLYHMFHRKPPSLGDVPAPSQDHLWDSLASTVKVLRHTYKIGSASLWSLRMKISSFIGSVALISFCQMVSGDSCAASSVTCAGTECLFLAISNL